MKPGDRVTAVKVAGTRDEHFDHVYDGILVGELCNDRYLVLTGDNGIRTSLIEMVTFDGDKKAYVHTKSGSLYRVELADEPR